MKKFFAIVFALIFALSACTVAFAAYTCESCKASLADEKAYKAHINGACKVDFKTCEYCSETIYKDNVEAHNAVCPEKAKQEADKDTENVKHVCEVCATVFTNRTDYMAHMNSGCLVAYKPCPYCGATIDDAALEDHKNICPKGACDCDYCFDSFATEGDFEAHIDACKATYFNIPVAKIVRAVINFFKTTDWGSIFGKIGDLVKGIDLSGIINTVKPLLEKIPALFEGLGK